jgi:hypothetical protein
VLYVNIYCLCFEIETDLLGSICNFLVYCHLDEMGSHCHAIFRFFCLLLIQTEHNNYTVSVNFMLTGVLIGSSLLVL